MSRPPPEMPPAEDRPATTEGGVAPALVFVAMAVGGVLVLGAVALGMRVVQDSASIADAGTESAPELTAEVAADAGGRTDAGTTVERHELGRLGGPALEREGSIGIGNLGHGRPGPGLGYGRAPSGTRVPASVPRVRTGQAVIRGSLGPEVIRRIIRRHINEARTCYEHQLDQEPGLEGRVVVAFVISASGEVSSAGVAESSLANPAAERCLVAAVRRWTFPQPDGGGIVSVRYPFIFTMG